MKQHLCVFVILLFTAALLFTAGCTGTGSPAGSSAMDPAIGSWTQTGNTSIIVTLAPDGNALLRFRMPPADDAITFADSSGRWTRTGTDRIEVTYTGPQTGEIRTLNIVLLDKNEIYVDSVMDANGTVISPVRNPEDKIHFVRAGTSSLGEPMALMEIVKS